MRSITTPAETGVGFDEMVIGSQRKHYMLAGKGGVGKTSCAASLAVKFANHGHPTIIVSTDPAHSLSDSFAQVSNQSTMFFFELRLLCWSLVFVCLPQFFCGSCSLGIYFVSSSPGLKWRDSCSCSRSWFSIICSWGIWLVNTKMMPFHNSSVSSPDWCRYLVLALWQINPEKAREEFRTASQGSGSSGMKDLMDSMGLGILADQVNNHPWLHQSYLKFLSCHLLIVQRWVVSDIG